MSRAREPGGAGTTPHGWPDGRRRTTEIHTCPQSSERLLVRAHGEHFSCSPVTPYDSEREDERSCFQMGKLRRGEMKPLA